MTCTATETHFCVSGTTTAYQIINPVSGYIHGTKCTLERARKAIDTHGDRWQTT